MMKRIILILSAMLLVFSLCACGQKTISDGYNEVGTEEKTDSFTKIDGGISIDEMKTTDEDDASDEETKNTTTPNTTKRIEKTTKKPADSPSVSPGRFGDWDDSNTEIFPQIRQITRDTPGHDGVNLREQPNSKSDLIMVIPEGTEVLLVDEMASSDSYWKVRVKADGKEYTGYVLERYVSTFSGVGFSYRVSYNTPDHAGLVLRSEATSKSEKIIVVPEGSDVRVWEDLDVDVDKSTKNYWSVDVYCNGRIYSGYLLGRYVEYK